MAKMAGERSSWMLLAGLTGVVLGQPLACDAGGKDGESSVDPVIAEVLAAVGPEVVVPTLTRVVERAETLRDATEDWKAATVDATADASEIEAARDAARVAWGETMGVWQEAELHQLGPAASSLTAVAGDDRRDAIYSWPTVNPCRVDQETVLAEWDDADFGSTRLVNALGLDAIEHLLYAPSENACPSQVDINADGTWDALGADGVEANRAAYALALSEALLSDATALRDAWSDGFAEDLAAAGTEASVYTSDVEALNAVFDALFYLETATKDRKLAQPLGLRDCSAATCPEDVESLPSGRSTDWIVANLDGFEALFTGGTGTGMDDLLHELGHGDLADQVLADVASARAAAAAVERPIEAALESDPESVEVLYAAVQRVADALKGDLATVLSLQIPSEAAGDND